MGRRIERERGAGDMQVHMGATVTAVSVSDPPRKQATEVMIAITGGAVAPGMTIAVCLTPPLAREFAAAIVSQAHDIEHGPYGTPHPLEKH